MIKELIRKGYRIYKIPGFRLTREVDLYFQYRGLYVDHNPTTDIVIVKNESKSRI